MITRLTSVLAACGALLLTGSAQATPYAGQFRYLYAETVSLHGADGATWRLSVVATKSGAAESRPEQNLYVDLDRCVASSCTKVGRWVASLPASSIAVDGTMLPAYSPMAAPTDSSVGRLRTTLGGVPLRVDLAGGSEGGGINSTGLSGAALYVDTSLDASGTLRLGRATCRLTRDRSGIGEVSLAVDPVGDDARDPRTPLPARMPAGFFTGKHAATC